MRLGTCPRERDVQEKLALGQWPAAIAPELRAHVEGCRGCKELVLLTTAFGHARNEAAAEAKLGSPGLLWWRAQLRRRNAALERIGKPILGAQIFALGVYAVLAVAFVAWQARSGFAWLTRLEGAPQSAVLHWDSLWSSALSGSVWTPLVLISAAVTATLLGGAVVYLASDKQ